MSAFHDRLRTLIKASGYDYKALSLAIGQGERYISNLLSTGSDPGYSCVVKICAALGLTPNQLTGLDDHLSVVNKAKGDQIVKTQAERILTSVTKEAQRRLTSYSARPLLDDVLTWWHQQRGEMSNFEALSEHVDLYTLPDPGARLPQPHRVGQQSLAATSFGIESAEQLRHLLTTFDKTLCEQVTLAHVETARGQPQLSVQEIDVSLPGHKFPLRFVYKRLLLPVRDSRGNEFVMNFSQAIE